MSGAGHVPKMPAREDATVLAAILSVIAKIRCLQLLQRLIVAGYGTQSGRAAPISMIPITALFFLSVSHVIVFPFLRNPRAFTLNVFSLPLRLLFTVACPDRPEGSGTYPFC
jgi:hypothetical protein